MKKFLIDFKIVKNERLSDSYSLFVLEPINGELPEMHPDPADGPPAARLMQT